ncbi:hypothetical protein KEM56_000622 [Ascosphaera pollenicola]|nr:hypothetical protein KEM56_000622 [Ascosphaera pollenicola]
MYAPSPGNAYVPPGGPPPASPVVFSSPNRSAPMMIHQGSQQGVPPQPGMFMPHPQSPFPAQATPHIPPGPGRPSYPQNQQPPHYPSSPHQSHHPQHHSQPRNYSHGYGGHNNNHNAYHGPPSGPGPHAAMAVPAAPPMQGQVPPQPTAGPAPAAGPTTGGEEGK